MARGLSVHIGLNSVDPAGYGGWSGPLNACEQDAKDMESIAKSNGFVSLRLLTAEATSSRVLDSLGDAASSLEPGDTLFLSYSGHGGQIPDSGRDEPDARDETWCLYDRMLIDDELGAAWKLFKDGVRVIMLSDSCHSGTVSKVAMFESATKSEDVRERIGEKDYYATTARFRLLPYEQAVQIYNANEALYLSKKWGKGPDDAARDRGATVLLISGCQDAQLSLDGPQNGLFTAKLLEVWDRGSFSGDYRRFHAQIRARMPWSQQPNYSVVGPPNQAFERERPFALLPIGAPGGAGPPSVESGGLVVKILDLKGQMYAMVPVEGDGLEPGADYVLTIVEGEVNIAPSKCWKAPCVKCGRVEGSVCLGGIKLNMGCRSR